jgi:hypothetical protein
VKQRSGQHGDGFLFRSKMVSRLGTGILSLLLVVGLSVISSSPALAGTTWEFTSHHHVTLVATSLWNFCDDYGDDESFRSDGHREF